MIRRPPELRGRVRFEAAGVKGAPIDASGSRKCRATGTNSRQEENFWARVLRKRPLAALSDPARAGVLRKRGAAAQAVPVGFCIFCSLAEDSRTADETFFGSEICLTRPPRFYPAKWGGSCSVYYSGAPAGPHFPPWGSGRLQTFTLEKNKNKNKNKITVDEPVFGG